MSQLKILSNKVKYVAISSGDELMPAIKLVIGSLQKLSDWFSGLSQPTKSTIAIFTAVAAAIMLIVGPILLVIGFIPAILSGLTAIATVFGTTVAVLLKVVAIGAWVIGVFIALGAALVYAYQKS